MKWKIIFFNKIIIFIIDIIDVKFKIINYFNQQIFSNKLFLLIMIITQDIWMGKKLWFSLCAKMNKNSSFIKFSFIKIRKGNKELKNNNLSILK